MQCGLVGRVRVLGLDGYMGGSGLPDWGVLGASAQKTGICLTPPLTPINYFPENYTGSALWLDIGHNDKHNKRQ